MRRTLALFCLGLLALTACGPQFPTGVAEALPELPESVDFQLHVKPILSDRCFACHGPDQQKREAGLRLDLPETALAELQENPGHFAIVPGDVKTSQLVQRVLHEDPEVRMPPQDSKLFLSDREKAVLIRWIEQGAEYQSHWSLAKAQRKALPPVKAENWPRNKIDYFVLSKLEEMGWQPSPEADKATLLRRLSLDLTGLPPGLEELDAFLADHSPQAYEKAVDRLLASPHFGERLAVDWMDLARFADTHGYTVDRYRDMSPWRDWVIQAFNDNMPYDQFVSWQLAGDMFPQASHAQIKATAFNRNHQQNMEGGIVPEEFRVEYVADRTETFGTAFLGLTVGCARCHDHKYDPLSHQEYYQLFSFFNNVKEAGQISYDNAMPAPTLLLTDAETERILAYLKGKIRKGKAQLSQTQETETSAFQQWLEKDRLSATYGQGLPKGAQAHFPLESPSFRNRLNSRQQGSMKQQHAKTVKTHLGPGKSGQGLNLDGDAWLDLGEIGVFDRASPFSIGIWVKLPKSLKNGVIFHKGEGAAIYNFRGYHLALADNRLEVMMAHNAPYNAITKYARDLPRDQWIHLLLSYDGSASAAGLQVYLNGQALPTQVETDHLYKSILFPERKVQPGLQIGARWRGIGIKGAVVDDITVFDRALTPPEVMQVYDPVAYRILMKKTSASLSATEWAGLQQYYSAHFSTSYQRVLADQQQGYRRYFATLDTVPELMVMNEMAQARPTPILLRGQYDAYGDTVFPQTPQRVLPMSASMPRNRLGLTQWLFLPEHPLTARVAVNRYWQMIFGRGLVKTAEDFGSQGALPSHPALLDELALHFMESGWDVKALLKYMVMSATYRQASNRQVAQAEADPENVFLWHGPSQRLSAEMIRDQALAASGLLVRKMGGPSVKPYQPEGLWRVNNAHYQVDEGEKLHRRGLYTFWKRSVPHPSQGTFDAPTRSNCTVRRQKTSTPLQALILLNDPIYLEAAQAMGARMAQVIDLQTGIRDAFRRLTGRQPEAHELSLLEELYQHEYAKFQAQPGKMTGWLQTGQASTGNQPERLAACTVVASTLLNADASIIKR